MSDSTLALARGHYQRSVLLGRASVSGRDLRGRARTWSARYHWSRVALLGRLTAAGVSYRIESDRLVIVDTAAATTDTAEVAQ